MDDLSVITIVKWCCVGVLYFVCAIIGIQLLFTTTEILLAFASTGVGAVILLIIGWRVYVKHFKE